MRITQARTTAKKVLTLNDIKGVDLSSAPLSVKPTRASYMKNMICKGGVNHKRNGFIQAAQFFDSEGNGAKINGIYPYKFKDGWDLTRESIIVHAGTKLFLCEPDFSYNSEIKLVEGVSLENEKSHGFTCEGRFFLESGNRLLYLNTDEEWKLLPLFDKEQAYVPTTSIGITDNKHGSLLEPFEEINIFSTCRKNKLIGVKNEVKEKITVDGIDAELYSPSLSQATYILDGLIDTSKKMIIKASFFIGGFSSSRNEELPCSTDKSSTNIRVETIFNVSSYSEECSGGSTAIYKNGETLNIEYFQTELSFYNSEKRFIPTVIVENKDGHGVITFTPALPSPVLGEDNITVEYSVAKEEPKIKYACEVALTPNGKQLAIVTEDDVVYYSSPAHGWGYFPDKSYIRSINNVTAVFDGEGALVVASRHESAVISFNIRESDGLVVVPRVNAIYSDIGTISPYASVNLEGDTLVLTRKGIFGIGTRGAYIRSSAINKELLKFSEKDFEQAVACEHDARYYLFIGGIVYIADARYKVKFHEGERLASSYEYEWWRWELGAPSSVLCHNDKMYIGRDDGRVLCLSDGYVDREVLELENGEYTFDGEVFTLDTDINLNGANLEIANAYKKMTYISDVDKKLTEISGGVITNGSTEKLLMEVTYSENLDKIIDRAFLFEGLKVFVSVSDEDIDIEFEGEIETIYLEYNAVNIKVPADYITEVLSSFGDSTHVNLYPYVARDIYTLEQIENDGDYYLKDRDGNRTLFYKYDEMTAKLTYDKPVECELHSAVLNLGSDIKEKVLHELCFVPSVETTGEVLLGFETNKNGDLSLVGDFGGAGIISGLTSSTSLDIGGLDFNSFTFDASFVHTFKKRLHERGVEFVKFKIASKTADDFGVERLNCIYSYYTR